MNAQNIQSSRRRGGSAMIELVLLLPVLLFFMGLVFYMSQESARIERVSMVARYEAWRDVAWRLLDWHDANWDARAATSARWPDYFDPGPSYDGNAGGEALLHHDFLFNRADWFDRIDRDDYFPDAPYDQAVRAVGQGSAGANAEAMLQTYFYRSSGEPRMSRGERQVFEAGHLAAARMWQRITGILGGSTSGNAGENAITRSHVRIGDEWAFQHDWSISHPYWQTFSRMIPDPIRNNHDKLNEPHRTIHLLRATRDSFFMDFDLRMDAWDGDTGPEYDDDAAGPQYPGNNLAGIVRQLYLAPPGYRGPIIGSE